MIKGVFDKEKEHKYTAIMSFSNFEQTISQIKKVIHLASIGMLMFYFYLYHHFFGIDFAFKDVFSLLVFSASFSPLPFVANILDVYYANDDDEYNPKQDFALFFGVPVSVFLFFLFQFIVLGRFEVLIFLIFPFYSILVVLLFYPLRKFLFAEKYKNTYCIVKT